MRSTRLAFIGLLGLTASALASFPIGNLQNTPIDQVFRIYSRRDITDQNGTAELLGLKLVDANNLKLTLLTADHVYSSQYTRLALGFRGEGQANTFGFTPFDFTQDTPKNGDKYVDLSFVGLHIRKGENGVTAAQFDLLKALTPLELAVAPQEVEEGFDFKSYGYGVSARADNAHEGFAYVWHKNVADEQYGKQRFWSNKVTVYDVFEDPTYKYQAMRFNLRQAVAGDGFGAPGDSGSGIYNAGGKVIGIVTQGQKEVLEGTEDKPTKLGWKYGFKGTAVRMTADYKTWFETKSNAYLVPEPASMLALALGVAAVARRRLRKRPGSP